MFYSARNQPAQPTGNHDGLSKLEHYVLTLASAAVKAGRPMTSDTAEQIVLFANALFSAQEKQ